MTYEAWRICYQSSEQAARAAYTALLKFQEVGAVCGEEFHYHSVKHGLPNNTKLYARKENSHE